jgi:queuine tRNA-ribosyltransferase
MRKYATGGETKSEQNPTSEMIKNVPSLDIALSDPKYGYPSPQTFPQSLSTPYFKFELVYQSKKSAARVGRIHTPHGIIETPGFVPVATNAALKYLDISKTDSLGLETQLIFANTYHMMIHPGEDEVAAAGGVHRYCGYSGPMITDSGGFQVFSMANTTSQDELKGKIARKTAGGGKKVPNLLKKISERGALFRSYRDGKLIELTPESSVQAQKKFGADIIIPLDILLPNAVSTKKLLEAFHRTHRWEAASLREHLKDLKQQAMYAVLHGGTNRDLRALSIAYLSQLPFQGMAIGGSLGRNTSEMWELLQDIMPLIPRHFPVHLLGIGDPASVRVGSSLGIDTFDSAYPTKTGRHGQFFTENGSVDLGKPLFRSMHNKPPVEGCTCSVCSSHSAAYVHHLFAMNEPIALSMGATHNIHFMMNMMKQIRKDILDGNL